MKTKKRRLSHKKPKIKQFGHSERELWIVNCIGCPYFAKVMCSGHYICTNKQNRNARRHSACMYNACPIKQQVAYEDYEQDEDEY